MTFFMKVCYKEKTNRQTESYFDTAIGQYM